MSYITIVIETEDMPLETRGDLINLIAKCAHMADAKGIYVDDELVVKQAQYRWDHEESWQPVPLIT